ncbi:MAG: hypothetical protein E6G03_08065 [Actinobacteria bacterium]|nr:MAG: hypothetical protein E6G03_08065 [Actinomycetota bacterium]
MGYPRSGIARRRPVVVAAQSGRNTLTPRLQEAPPRPASRTRASTASAAVSRFPGVVSVLGTQEDVAVTEPLLERHRELERIETALAEARTGRGRFLVIEGPAGIGKTALLAAARTAAADSGMRVLRSRGTELERDFAFGVVRQLFESPLAEASELERSDLLQASAGGSRRPLRASIPRSPSSTASTGCAQT